MSARSLTAIYGGTFSPPHLGHVRAAEAFYRAVSPDRFLIIPSAIPPHKSPVAGADDASRLAMCRMAFSSLKEAEISDMELRRSGRSYTVETLHALAAEDTALTMLIGTDMFLSLDTWYLAEEIFSLTEISVIRRESLVENTALVAEKCREYERKYAARVRFIDADVTEISSTELRRRLASGEPTDGLLTPDVLAYIRERGLYRHD